MGKEAVNSYMSKLKEYKQVLPGMNVKKRLISGIYSKVKSEKAKETSNSLEIIGAKDKMSSQ